MTERALENLRKVFYKKVLVDKVLLVISRNQNATGGMTASEIIEKLDIDASRVLTGNIMPSTATRDTVKAFFWLLSEFYTGK